MGTAECAALGPLGPLCCCWLWNDSRGRRSVARRSSQELHFLLFLQRGAAPRHRQVTAACDSGRQFPWRRGFSGILAPGRRRQHARKPNAITQSTSRPCRRQSGCRDVPTNPPIANFTESINSFCLNTKSENQSDVLSIAGNKVIRLLITFRSNQLLNSEIIFVFPAIKLSGCG